MQHPKTRKDKLVLLQSFLNLETGKVNEQAFKYENSLYKKAIEKKSLDARIRKCRLCKGLNIKRFTDSCPGWGDLNAKILFVGQSLHKPGIISGLPFILGSGYCLDAALRLSGLLRKDVFFSNVVHCHPEGNRASTDEEKENCLPFLAEEISIVRPELIVALGNDAKWAINHSLIQRFGFKSVCMKHPASFMYAAPEERANWIVKLSLKIDRVYKEK